MLKASELKAKSKQSFYNYCLGEGKETKTKHVDLHDLAKLTDENIANLITKGQKQQNNTNA